MQMEMNYCSSFYILKLSKFDWQGKNIKTISGNITAASVINKKGVSKNQALNIKA